MPNRFQSLFDLFNEGLGPIANDALKQYQKHKLAFCFHYDRMNHTGQISVYENVDQESTIPGSRFAFGAESVKAGNDIVYNDKIWFVYEELGKNPTLEALISYIEDYRPKVVVHLSKPLMTLKVAKVPYIEGFTPKDVIPVSQSTLF